MQSVQYWGMTREKKLLANIESLEIKEIYEPYLKI